MLKISDALREIIRDNPYLEFGLNNDITNLSKLAHLIKPVVETYLQKEVQMSALVMNLSKFQRERKKFVKDIRKHSIENITLLSNLITVTFYKTPQIEAEVGELNRVIGKRKGYFGHMEGMNEIAIVLEKRFSQELEKTISAVPKFKNDSVAALIIKYPKSYAEDSGFLYSVFRILALQNVSVVEAVTTYSELALYIERKDIQKAFDLLEKTFLQE